MWSQWKWNVNKCIYFTNQSQLSIDSALFATFFLSFPYKYKGDNCRMNRVWPFFWMLVESLCVCVLFSLLFLSFTFFYYFVCSPVCLYVQFYFSFPPPPQPIRLINAFVLETARATYGMPGLLLLSISFFCVCLFRCCVLDVLSPAKLEYIFVVVVTLVVVFARIDSWFVLFCW